MKNKHIIIPSIFFAVIAIVSCQSKESLSKDIAGTWQSTPEQIIDNDSISVDLIKSYEFMPVAGTDEGSLIISGMLSIQRYMPQSDSIIAPLTINAAASASVTGKYQALSYDKILLIPDISAFELSIDPSVVSYDFDAITNSAAPDLSAMKPAWTMELVKYLTPAVRGNFMAVDTLTDVKAKDTLLHLNDGTQPLTLRLQTPQ